jgi:hypothetical protein
MPTAKSKPQAPGTPGRAGRRQPKYRIRQRRGAKQRHALQPIGPGRPFDHQARQAGCACTTAARWASIRPAISSPTYRLSRGTRRTRLACRQYCKALQATRQAMRYPGQGSVSGCRVQQRRSNTRVNKANGVDGYIPKPGNFKANKGRRRALLMTPKTTGTLACRRRPAAFQAY